MTSPPWSPTATPGAARSGVLWSNQTDDALYFAAHPDGAGDAAGNWTRATLCAATLCPDDHLNIKSIDADTSGHIYAAVKTSLNDKSPRVGSDPLIVIYRLNTAGGWTSSTAWTVAENVTRAIVVIDSQNRRVHTFAAGPCCDGGTIWTKDAPLDNPTFPGGLGDGLHQEQRRRSPSRRTTPPPPSRRSTPRPGCWCWPASTEPATTCTTTAAGRQHSPADAAADPAPGRRGERDPDRDRGQLRHERFSPTTNFGTSALLNIDASPTAHSYLKFDLSPYGGRTVTGAVLQVRATTSGSTGTQSVKLVTDDGWTETGLNFNNAPARGTVLGTLGADERQHQLLGQPQWRPACKVSSAGRSRSGWTRRAPTAPTSAHGRRRHRPGSCSPSQPPSASADRSTPARRYGDRIPRISPLPTIRGPE